MSKDVIIACDFNSKADLMTFLDKFENEDRKPFLKVGMELQQCMELLMRTTCHRAKQAADIHLLDS